MNDFITIDMLATFSGLVLATGIITQFTKSIIKRKFEDYIVRLYVFIIAAILTFVFASNGYDMQGIILTIINSIIIAMASIGGYEILADPKARKQ